MAAPIPIRPWHWAGFILGVLALVALDLRLSRGARDARPGRALWWSLGWIGLAMAFAGALALWRNREESLQFLTGYSIEFSLSLDNLFAMALIFQSFGVAEEHQHRVLYWGILGALVMRGLMIVAGATLLQSFNWLFYPLGLFLVVTGLRWAFSKHPLAPAGDNWVVRAARRIFPVAGEVNSGRFLTTANGRRALTPLALVLLAIEATDVVFAVDSIPAVLAVTQNSFIVFTSNVFAILGLRSLYTLLSGAMSYFRYLKTGLALVLIVIGLKMLLTRWFPIPAAWSLALVVAIVAGAMGLSLAAQKRHSNPPQ